MPHVHLEGRNDWPPALYVVHRLDIVGVEHVDNLLATEILLNKVETCIEDQNALCLSKNTLTTGPYCLYMFRRAR